MNSEMNQTYILVDFENVQPTDMGLLIGDQYQLRIFRGPHQKKLDFNIVESLQPFGDRVKYIQSDRHGRNALDLQIAFYMGRLIEELESNGTYSNSNIRFLVISKDSGFDALMSHVQSLGYGAKKAANVRQALGLDEPETDTGNANRQVNPDRVGQVTRHAIDSLTGKKSSPDESASSTSNTAPVPKTPTSKSATPAALGPAEIKATTNTPPVKKASPLVRRKLFPNDREKVLEHLRQHPRNRPVKRITLERHLTSLLGGNVVSNVVQGLITAFTQEGYVKFKGNKIIEYKIPKNEK